MASHSSSLHHYGLLLIDQCNKACNKASLCAIVSEATCDKSTSNRLGKEENMFYGKVQVVAHKGCVDERLSLCPSFVFRPLVSRW